MRPLPPVGGKREIPKIDSTTECKVRRLLEGCGYLESSQVARDRDWHGAAHLKGAWLKKASPFCLVAEPLCVAPGRGDFSVSNFHPRPIPGNLAKTIFGVREVAGAEEGGLFLGYLLGKNYRRRDRDRLVPPRWMDAAVYRAEVCYPFGGKHGSH
jgi:hypothetical protein